jgi:hypothetical protein
MIKLTDETKTITVKTKNHNVGDVVDNSLYLERLDANNLVLRRGTVIQNYFGDVRQCLHRSLNYAVKGSDVALSLESILETIKSMDETIKRLDKECV